MAKDKIAEALEVIMKEDSAAIIATIQAENENLKEVINQQEAKITEQDATLANMMKDVSELVEASEKKSATIVSHEGQDYKLLSPMVIVDTITYNAASLQKNPAAIASILATKDQNTLIAV